MYFVGALCKLARVGSQHRSAVWGNSGRLGIEAHGLASVSMCLSTMESRFAVPGKSHDQPDNRHILHVTRFVAPGKF